MLVVGVEKQEAIVCCEEIVQLAFSLLYPLERAEALQVCPSDICYHAACGLCVVDEFLDVAGMACTHLYDSYVVAGIHTQKRFGYSHVVVEVALSVHYAVLF